MRKCILIFRNVYNVREDWWWGLSYLSWSMWTHFLLPVLCILSHSISQEGWQSWIGISGNAVYAAFFSGIICRKQVISQQVVEKQQGAGGVWGRVILLIKPSRYYKVKLCNHRELHRGFTVPGNSQERPVRAECFSDPGLWDEEGEKAKYWSCLVVAVIRQVAGCRWLPVWNNVQEHR